MKPATKDPARIVVIERRITSYIDIQTLNSPAPEESMGAFCTVDFEISAAVFEFSSLADAPEAHYLQSQYFDSGSWSCSKGRYVVKIEKT